MNTNESRIHRYFELAAGADREAYFSQFAPHAVVEDEGKERHGEAEIRSWRGEIPRVQYEVREVREVRELAGEGDGVRAVARISGEFPGSPVDLTFAFGFADDGRIERLVIRP